MAVPTVTFNDGNKMPMFGLGTLLSKSGEVLEAVKYAIEIGYRHIDTAAFYENEKEIGEAVREKIKDGTIKREDIFITTKLWNNKHKESDVVPACKESLKKLGLDYVDLYLIHWPFAFKTGDELTPRDAAGKIEFDNEIDYLETWKGMEECKRQGLARSIGISNFNSQQIERLLSVATIKPVNNQVEVTINLNQKPLIDFCKQRNITVTGFSPLGRPGNRYGISNLWDEPPIQRLVKKYNKSPANIACRFILQLGVAPIPKSVTKERIKENFNIFDFSLTPEEVSEIENMVTGARVAQFSEAKEAKYYPFNIPY